VPLVILSATGPKGRANQTSEKSEPRRDRSPSIKQSSTIWFGKFMYTLDIIANSHIQGGIDFLK
jgi:hypothetical protein